MPSKKRKRCSSKTSFYLATKSYKKTRTKTGISALRPTFKKLTGPGSRSALKSLKQGRRPEIYAVTKKGKRVLRASKI